MPSSRRRRPLNKYPDETLSFRRVAAMIAVGASIAFVAGILFPLPWH